MIKECHEKKSVPTQTDILKGQTPAQRLRTARQLLDLARALKRAALRQQHSDLFACPDLNYSRFSSSR
jgi:hypothetical protein